MEQNNTVTQVIEASTAAFKAIPNIKKATESLTVLSGVGPATASG